jgi:hypothetical protein
MWRIVQTKRIRTASNSWLVCANGVLNADSSFRLRWKLIFNYYSLKQQKKKALLKKQKVLQFPWQRLQQKWTLQQKKEYEKLEREQKNPYYSPLKVLNKTKQLQASEAAKIICDKIWF